MDAIASRNLCHVSCDMHLYAHIFLVKSVWYVLMTVTIPFSTNNIIVKIHLNLLKKFIR